MEIFHSSTYVFVQDLAKIDCESGVFLGNNLRGGKRLVSPEDSRRGATDGTMRKNLATKADVTKDLEEGGDDEEEKHKNVPLPHWLVPIRTQIQKRQGRGV